MIFRGEQGSEKKILKMTFFRHGGFLKKNG
jgi:hypothetical protein